MKRRELKKNVNCLCGELFAECVALTQYDGVKSEDVAPVMESILIMQADMLGRISHVEPGSTKLFFKKFGEDLQQKTMDIIDDIMGIARTDE